MKFLLRNKEGIGLDQGLEKFSVKSFAGHIGSLSYSLFGIFSIKSSLKMQKKNILSSLAVQKQAARQFGHRP